MQLKSCWRWRAWLSASILLCRRQNSQGSPEWSRFAFSPLTQSANRRIEKKYVLGYVWYGGVLGDVTGNEVTKPTRFSFFTDYFSCSFVRIKGGKRLVDKVRPKFVNDMSQYSSIGCRSANDRPLICKMEPCEQPYAKYRKPAAFKNGKKPAFIKKANYMWVSNFRYRVESVSVQCLHPSFSCKALIFNFQDIIIFLMIINKNYLMLLYAKQ